MNSSRFHKDSMLPNWQLSSTKKTSRSCSISMVGLRVKEPTFSCCAQPLFKSNSWGFVALWALTLSTISSLTGSHLRQKPWTACTLRKWSICLIATLWTIMRTRANMPLSLTTNDLPVGHKVSQRTSSSLLISTSCIRLIRQPSLGGWIFWRGYPTVSYGF